MSINLKEGTLDRIVREALEKEYWRGYSQGKEHALLSRSYSIHNFGLSVRASNVLNEHGISLLGDIVKMTEADFLRIPHFGRKSLNEIKEHLKNVGLHLGMTEKEITERLGHL